MGANRTDSRRILLRCFGYLRPHWPRTIGAYLTLLGINALVLTIPQFIRWIVDQGIGGKDTFLLGWSVLALLGLTVVKGGLTFLQGQWTETISQNVAYDLRNDIHRKLSELSFAYHDQSETGTTPLAHGAGCGPHPIPDRAARFCESRMVSSY